MSAAWSIFKRHPGELIAGTVIALVAQYTAQFALNIVLMIPAHLMTGGEDLPEGVQALFGLAVAAAVFPLNAFFQIGNVRMALQAVRGQPVTLGTLFSGFDRLFVAVVASLITLFCTGAGLLLLVVPGIIILLGLSLVPLYAADTALDPVEALKASWRATTGRKTEILVLFVGMFIVGLAGLLACCIGLVAAIPVVNLMLAIAYEHLSGRAIRRPDAS